MDCVPASGSCGWFHMRPEISTANDVVLTDVSQLFFSSCQQTFLHSECNPNRNFKLSLITLTTPGGHLSRKWVIYWKLFICVHSKSFVSIKWHFIGACRCWLATGSGTSTGTFLVEKGLAFFCLLRVDLLGSHHTLSDHFLAVSSFGLAKWMGQVDTLCWWIDWEA